MLLVAWLGGMTRSMSDSRISGRVLSREEVKARCCLRDVVTIVTGCIHGSYRAPSRGGSTLHTRLHQARCTASPDRVYGRGLRHRKPRTENWEFGIETKNSVASVET